MINTFKLFKVLIFSFFNDFGSTVFTFSINLYILKQTGSAFAFSLGMIIIPLVNILFLPISGHIIDSIEHFKVIIGGLSIALFALIFTLISLPFIKKNYIILVLLILLFILRMCDVLVQSALLALLPTLFEVKQIQRVNSLNQSVVRLSEIFGPVVAGSLFYLISFVNIGWFEFVFDLLALLSIIGLHSQNKINTVQKGESKDSFKSHVTFRDTLSEMLHNHLILGYLILCLVSNIALSCFEIGVPFVMLEKLHYSSAEYGMVDSLFSVGAIAIGLFISGYNKNLSIRQSFYSFGIIGVGIIIIGGTFGIVEQRNIALLVIFLAAMLIGSGSILSNITMITNLQKNTSSYALGHVFTFFDTIVTASLPIFSVLFGILFQNNNQSWPFLAVGIIVFITIGFCLKRISIKQSSI